MSAPDPNNQRRLGERALDSANCCWLPLVGAG